MRPEDFITWLKRENLFYKVQNNFLCLKNVFDECLNIRNEQVLIVGDLGFPVKRISAIMIGCYLLVAKRLNLNYKLVIQRPKITRDTADTQLIEELLNLPDRSVLVLSLSGKLGSLKQMGKSFRRYIREKGHRFVSTTGLSQLKTGQLPVLISSININYKELQKKAAVIKEKLDFGKEINITTDKGTNLYINIKGMRAISNDGNYSKHGGNIPVGEVYIPPRGKRVDGKVIIDGCSRIIEGSVVVKTPITLNVEKGVITDIKGGIEARALEKALDWAHNQAKYPWGIRRIGELGIGINPGARITNSTIISEKTLGTAHVAIGSNAWFGGTVYSIIHLDQVFRNPKIWIDGQRLHI
jgi:hypothetical protein